MGLSERQTIEWHRLRRAARLANAEAPIRTADVDADQSPLQWGAKADARIPLDEFRGLGSEVTRKRESGCVLTARSPCRRPLRPLCRRDEAKLGLDVGSDPPPGRLTARRAGRWFLRGCQELERSAR